jgi:hypothetical protein
MDGAVVIGVVNGSARQPRMRHLVDPLPVTNDLLAMAAPARPAEVFRFAASCAGHACAHFDGADCRLVTRIVEVLPAAPEPLPVCRIRPNCRWWQQEGHNACMRCPLVVTESYNPSDEMREASDATVYAGCDGCA